MIDWTEIRPRLWQGAWPIDAAGIHYPPLAKVTEPGKVPFSAVLVCAHGGPTVPAYQQVRCFGTMGYHLPIGDAVSDAVSDERLQDAAGYVRQWLGGGFTVGVHCAGGISRSSYVMCAALMLMEGIDYEGAIAIVRAVRPQAQPNPGFEDHLRRWVPQNVWER